MDYFHMLDLHREPFSNSPDPGLFFPACRHRRCLQEIELSLRLRRGLNVIVGEVGTGKTTLCRQLIRQLADDPGMETHLIPYPDFATGEDFLKTLGEMLAPGPPDPSLKGPEIKEKIKQSLFQKCVEEDQTVILVIDEGQNLPGFCLEILREFLNYETNACKLMQIVIFAQKEMKETLRGRANFADRISLYYPLKALDFRDSRSMIHHRLGVSGRRREDTPLFSLMALWVIYQASRGYPRRIIHLCHRSLLAMIVQKQTRIGWRLARKTLRRTFSLQSFHWKRRGVAVALTALIALTAAGPIPATGENDDRLQTRRSTRFQGPSDREDSGDATATITEGETASTRADSPSVPQDIWSPVKEDMRKEMILGHYPYSIYLGSFRTLKLAERAVGVYTRQDLSSYWVRVDLGTSGTWYRVYTGYFKDRAAAAEFIRQRGLSDAEVKQTAYANLVGIFSGPVEGRRCLTELKELGFYPYAVDGREGVVSVFIGAYITKAGAMQNQGELQTAGIHSEVMER